MCAHEYRELTEKDAPRRFNAGLDSTEKTIVTSTGPYIVAWNFRHVKQGNTANYTLRRFSENIVADQFRFGGDRDIIVTLPGESSLSSQSSAHTDVVADYAPSAHQMTSLSRTRRSSKRQRATRLPILSRLGTDDSPLLPLLSRL